MKFLWDRFQKRPGLSQSIVVTVLAMGSSWGISLNGEEVANVVLLSSLVIAFLTDQKIHVDNPKN